MRGTFARTLTELAEADSRIVLLTGDLGYMALEPFAERFPDRFFNVGVAEQNMVGLSTGLAEAGFIPFVYSIVTFAALRAYEFVRNGPIAHGLPVRIVGVGGGVEYGQNGLTHYGLEDVGVMRLQPGLSVIAPADAPQTREALLQSWNWPGPVYYRLGKDDKLVVPELEARFEAGRCQVIGEGKDVLFVTTGNVAIAAVEAVKALKQQGVNGSVAIVSCFNPSPTQHMVGILQDYGLAMSVESHYITGGIGSYVAEVIAEHAIPCRLVRCGVRETPDGVSGSQAFLHENYGISSAALARNAVSQLAGGVG